MKPLLHIFLAACLLPLAACGEPAPRGPENHEHEDAETAHERSTTISEASATASGILTERSGPAQLLEMLDLSGRVELLPEGRSEVRARYAGRIVALTRSIGDQVRAGEALARVEASESLQTYALTAPITGVITERHANIGDLTGQEPLYVISDLTQLHAEFFVSPRDVEHLQPGQPIEVRSLSGKAKTQLTITALSPVTDAATQTVMVHVKLPNSAGMWRSGMAVEGKVVVSARQVPVAVRTRALQRLEGDSVVFMKSNTTYSARKLVLGQRTPDWTEVRQGLAPGETYVTGNAFVVRADIEKSGATHDH